MNETIIEAYQIPFGNIVPNIFKLDCVTAVHKSVSGKTIYHVKEKVNGNHATIYAYATNWICKYSDGKWKVLTDSEYNELKNDCRKR